MRGKRAKQIRKILGLDFDSDKSKPRGEIKVQENGGSTVVNSSLGAYRNVKRQWSALPWTRQAFIRPNMLILD